ncbi:hypothetical protein MY4824_005621 [Beauveria thailandica]
MPPPGGPRTNQCHHVPATGAVNPTLGDPRTLD